MCGGSDEIDLRTSTAPGETRTAAWLPSAAVVASSTNAATLVSRKLLDRCQNIRRLRQDLFFEIGAVGDRAIERGNALHRRIEELEQLVADTRGDFGAESAGQRVLVSHDDPVRLLDELGDA